MEDAQRDFKMSRDLLKKVKGKVTDKEQRFRSEDEDQR